MPEPYRMPITYPEILEVRTDDVRASWDDREPILYALGVGMARDPLDRAELAFVDERRLKVLPTFATILARRADPGPLPLNRALVLDGGRDLRIHRPFPAEGEVLMDGRILEVVDRGADKGAVITREVMIRDAADGAPIAALRTTVMARGDGGFGGPPPTPTPRSDPPDRAPDRTVEVRTRPDQALLYRLSGDRNPLHSNPEAAARAGFERPILHGLCTYGIACRALLQTYADYDPAAIARFQARFSAPCFPGEVLAVDLWRSGLEVAFQVRAAERGVVVIREGRAELC